jgi:DNA-binding CsgD family transcriptional regulator
MTDPALLEAIYEAAAVPELWPDVLARLAERVQSWGAAVASFDPTWRMRFTSTPNYRPTFEGFEANFEKYDNQRPKRALASGHNGFLHDLEMFTQDELDRDPVYRDFIYPHGIRWTAGTVIPTPTRDVLIFDFARREEDGVFDRKTMARLDQLRPHLARAALLSHRLGLRAARAATEAMATIGVPAAMVDAGGRAVSLNAELEALAPTVTTGAFDRVQFRSPQADALLREALARLAPGLETTPHVQSIPIAASEEREALVAHVLPVRRAAADIFVHSAALLVFTPVAMPTSPLAEVLTGLFDLSPAETRVARGIAGGLSLDDIAAAQNLSRETVRTQLKSVLLKTGTSRQVDLALLLSGTSALPRQTPEA